MEAFTQIVFFLFILGSLLIPSHRFIRRFDLYACANITEMSLDRNLFFQQYKANRITTQHGTKTNNVQTCLSLTLCNYVDGFESVTFLSRSWIILLISTIKSTRKCRSVSISNYSKMRTLKAKRLTKRRGVCAV